MVLPWNQLNYHGKTGGNDEWLLHFQEPSSNEYEMLYNYIRGDDLCIAIKSWSRSNHECTYYAKEIFNKHIEYISITGGLFNKKVYSYNDLNDIIVDKTSFTFHTFYISDKTASIVMPFNGYVTGLSYTDYNDSPNINDWIIILDFTIVGE